MKHEKGNKYFKENIAGFFVCLFVKQFYCNDFLFRLKIFRDPFQNSICDCF